jgi:hypothetical protein
VQSLSFLVDFVVRRDRYRVDNRSSGSEQSHETLYSRHFGKQEWRSTEWKVIWKTYQAICTDALIMKARTCCVILAGRDLQGI